MIDPCQCQPPQEPRLCTLCEKCGRLLPFDYSQIKYPVYSGWLLHWDEENPAHRLRDSIARAERKKGFK